MTEQTQAVNVERLWCLACGTVTRDMLCDCNRWPDDHDLKLEPNFVNYADEMQKTAHEQAQQIDALVNALTEAERFMAYFAGETDGCFSGLGTPTTCLATIRAALQSSPQVTGVSLNKKSRCTACNLLEPCSDPLCPNVSAGGQL